MCDCEYVCEGECVLDCMRERHAGGGDHSWVSACVNVRVFEMCEMMCACWECTIRRTLMSTDVSKCVCVRVCVCA